MIENHMHAKDMGINVRFSVEESPLGTGGAIKRAADRVAGESFLVMNGDVLTDINLERIIGVPNAVASVELKTGFGILETDGNTITGFKEKGRIHDMWMNAGIYHLQRDIAGDLPDVGDIERTLFPEYARRGRLGTVKFRDVWWYSIDSFKDIEECASRMKTV